jgi:hypothetical protein
VTLDRWDYDLALPETLFRLPPVAR